MSQRSATHDRLEEALHDGVFEVSPESGARFSGAILLVGAGAVLTSVGALLLEQGLPVEQCSQTSEAAARLRTGSVWVVVMLDHFGDGAGLDVAVSSLVRGNGAAVVLLYGDESVPDVVRAIRSGADLRLFSRCANPELVADCSVKLYRARLQEETLRGDRREFPRVLPAGVSIEAPPDCELVDLAPGGLAFTSEATFVPDATVEVVLRIGRGACLRVHGTVARQSCDAPGRQWAAIRFGTLSERVQRMLVGLTRRHLAARGPREMQRRFREASNSDVVPIASAERIAAFLQQAASDQLPFTIQGATGGSAWQSAILPLAPGAGLFAIEPPAIGVAIAPGQTLDFLLFHEFESYLFEAVIRHHAASGFQCEFPRVIYYSEKRSRIRHELPLADQLTVRLRDPRRHDSWLTFPLLEVSSTGASFQADLSTTLILPGSVFEAFAVGVGDTRVLSERAEVRHVTPLAGTSDFKVGVRFTAKGTPRAREAKPTLRATLDEAPASDASRRARLLKFPNGDGEVLTALLNQTTPHDQFSGPVVLLLPSWGHSKESFCGYAINLVESFERAGAEVAVVRMDYSHHKGESHIPPQNRTPGKEALRFTFSGALADAQAAIEYCFNNPLFAPTTLTLVAPSFNGQVALRLAATDARISHLVLPMSTPSTRDVLKNASGGLDYIGGASRKTRYGIVDFLGLLVDMDRVAADAISARLAFIEDAEEDIRKVRCPVTWFLGKHDAWIDASKVKHLLNQVTHGDVDLVVVETGHLPTHDESFVVAAEVSRATLHHLGIGTAGVCTSPPSLVRAVQQDEWARAPKAELRSAAEYWKGYLLGETAEALGYDVLEYTDAYADFAAAQLQLLQVGSGQQVLDAGAGTGQFSARLVAHSSDLPARLDLLDLVPDALERARQRILAIERSRELRLHLQVADLQVSRLAPVQRFLAGEYHSVTCLRHRIPGLTNDVIDRLEREYRGSGASLLHSALRGESISPERLGFLDAKTLNAVLDFGRAARFLRRRTSEADLAPQHALEGKLLLSGDAISGLNAGHLRFDSLEFGAATHPARLPLVSERYDRVVCSLVLPYLLNPDETLMELVRTLRPGGILVVSTMKPDMDISGLQLDLIDKITSGRATLPSGASGDWILAELRAHTSAAARLLRLTDEGTFNFFGPGELSALLGEAGLVDVELRECFGQPPQAYVAAGRKPSTS